MSHHNKTFFFVVENIRKCPSNQRQWSPGRAELFVAVLLQAFRELVGSDSLWEASFRTVFHRVPEAGRALLTYKNSAIRDSFRVLDEISETSQKDKQFLAKRTVDTGFFCAG